MYVHTYVNIYTYFNTGPPTTAPMNIMFPPDDINNESFVVQWDAVDDFFPIIYTVRWYRGDDEIGMANVTGLRHTVIELTNNTYYNITVVAINTCCGAGPVSNVTMVMTNNQPPTMPPPTTATATAAATPTPTVTTGNIHITYVFTYYLCNKYTYFTDSIHCNCDPVCES